MSHARFGGPSETSKNPGSRNGLGVYGRARRTERMRDAGLRTRDAVSWGGRAQAGQSAPSGGRAGEQPWEVTRGTMRGLDVNERRARVPRRGPLSEPATDARGEGTFMSVPDVNLSAENAHFHTTLGLCFGGWKNEFESLFSFLWF